ncbi:MAG TPA: hypothetical protein VM266_11920 [Solirubrobacteraceae bacterium]|nr:hypothetical protein [Solirubrobacteraceae bacterium]
MTSNYTARFLTLALAALAALLLAPAAAPAKIIELGKTAQEPEPSCPAKPCLAVSRTTGYQVKIGTERDLFVVPRAGRIVAWTIHLGSPTKKQISFFNQTLGGAPSAGISVLKPGERLYGRVLSQSPVETLTPYLGDTVQFPLERSLSVKKGNLIGLTVPTWAPALAVGFGNDTSWRASRREKKCSDTAMQTALTSVRALGRFQCLYRTARLTYSVTMITSPKPARKKKRS